MKKTIFALAAMMALTACTAPKVDALSATEYNGAWYWIITYTPEATKADIEGYVKRYANPKQTSFFYAYPDTMNLDNFQTVPYSLEAYTDKIVSQSPTYGYYKLPMDDRLYDDAVWLLEMSKQK